MNSNQSELYELFVRFEWLLRRHQLKNLREFGPMADPHRGQGRVLALLKLKPEISQKELSTILDIRSQSLGELLSKLERSGYITRSPSETDRRVIQIRLTEAGKEAANQNEQQPDNDNLFGCLNEEEQDTLENYLKRIIDGLEKQLGDEESDFRGRDPRGCPPFVRSGFEPHFDLPEGRNPFAAGNYGQRPGMGRGRFDIGGRCYDEHPNMDTKTDGSDKV